MMDQTLLLCIEDEAFADELSRLCTEAGFRVDVCRAFPPPQEEFENRLPDAVLLDAAVALVSGCGSLETFFKQYPSIAVILLASSSLDEQNLFSFLKCGARAWIFKEKPEQTVSDLERLLDEKHFLKPSVSELILSEFKHFADGEPLLAVEEEILRQSARGVSVPDLEKNLSLSQKWLSLHWESIWQKLNINASAKKEIDLEMAGAVASTGIFHEAIAAPQGKELSGESVVSQPPAAAHPEAFVQIVTFALGKEEYGLAISQLQEIQKMLTVTPLPGAKPYVVGICNLRGSIVPVVDLRVLLGLPAASLTREARIMVVSLQDKIVGIIVDSVKEVVRVLPAQLEAPPPLVLQTPQRPIQSIINLGNRIILLLDLEKSLLREPAKVKVSLEPAGG